MSTCLKNMAWSAGSFVAKEVFNAPKTIVFTLVVTGGFLYLKARSSNSNDEFNESLNDGIEKTTKIVKELYEVFCKSIRAVSPFHDRRGESDYVPGEGSTDFTIREKLAGGLALIVVPVGIVALITVVFKSYLYLSVKGFDLPFVLPWKALQWMRGSSSL